MEKQRHRAVEWLSDWNGIPNPDTIDTPNQSIILRTDYPWLDKDVKNMHSTALSLLRNFSHVIETNFLYTYLKPPLKDRKWCSILYKKKGEVIKKSSITVFSSTVNEYCSPPTDVWSFIHRTDKNCQNETARSPFLWNQHLPSRETTEYRENSNCVTICKFYALFSSQKLHWTITASKSHY